MIVISARQGHVQAHTQTLIQRYPHFAPTRSVNKIFILRDIAIYRHKLLGKKTAALYWGLTVCARACVQFGLISVFKGLNKLHSLVR